MENTNNRFIEAKLAGFLGYYILERILKSLINSQCHVFFEVNWICNRFSLLLLDYFSIDCLFLWKRIELIRIKVRVILRIAEAGSIK